MKLAQLAEKRILKGFFLCLISVLIDWALIESDISLNRITLRVRQAFGHFKTILLKLPYLRFFHVSRHDSFALSAVKVHLATN